MGSHFNRTFKSMVFLIVSALLGAAVSGVLGTQGSENTDRNNTLTELGFGIGKTIIYSDLVLSPDSRVDSTHEAHKNLMVQLCDVVAYHDLVVTLNKTSDHGVDKNELDALLKLLQRNVEDSCKAFKELFVDESNPTCSVDDMKTFRETCVVTPEFSQLSKTASSSVQLPKIMAKANSAWRSLLSYIIHSSY